MNSKSTALLDFLSDPTSYPHRPDRVEMIQTHASWVFIASPFVYKVKKPVDLGFLNFSTLELRHADCGRELLLNRRLAPDIYLSVDPICESACGLTWGGEGNVVEWAVKMRELDRSFLLTRLLRENKVGKIEIDRILEVLVAFYAGGNLPAASETATASQRLRQSIMDNLKLAWDFIGICLSKVAWDALLHYNEEFFTMRKLLLDSRIREGWIRDCHGDLHAEHIQVMPDVIRIYDCIEFNTRFRCIDVACDLAFLAMDLDFHGRPDLAAHLIEQASIRLRDPDLKSLIDFYRCYRSCVRGKVECLRISSGELSEGEKTGGIETARQYFQLALRYATLGSEPAVLVVMGRVASGKSSFAAMLGDVLGCKVLSSDHLRKSVAGMAPAHRGSLEERASLYSSKMTKQVYQLLAEGASKCLGEQRWIVVDATFSKRLHREAFELELAKGGRCVWIEVMADEATMKKRLAERDTGSNVVSDARLEDYSSLNAIYETPEELRDRIALVNEGDIEKVVASLLATLVERQLKAGTWA